MSINELNSWAEYLSMEPSNSIEIQLALLTTIVANMMGGKKSVDDFIITSYRPKVDKPIFMDEADVKNIFSLISK